MCSAWVSGCVEVCGATSCHVSVVFASVNMPLTLRWSCIYKPVSPTFGILASGVISCCCFYHFHRACNSFCICSETETCRICGVDCGKCGRVVSWNLISERRYRRARFCCARLYCWALKRCGFSQWSICEPQIKEVFQRSNAVFQSGRNGVLKCPQLDRQEQWLQQGQSSLGSHCPKAD